MDEKSVQVVHTAVKTSGWRIEILGISFGRERSSGGAPILQTHQVVQVLARTVTTYRNGKVVHGEWKEIKQFTRVKQ
jgi:hypothetical protein